MKGTRHHKGNARRQAKKAQRRQVEAAYQVERARIGLEERVQWLQDNVSALSLAVRDRMIADGCKVRDRWILAPDLFTVTDGESGDLGFCRAHQVHVLPLAFRYRMEVEVLVHELVHFWDADCHKTAYIRPEDDYAGYFAQACEVLARHYEARWSELIANL